MCCALPAQLWYQSFKQAGSYFSLRDVPMVAKWEAAGEAAVVGLHMEVR
jgi:hypothetical protein